MLHFFDPPSFTWGPASGVPNLAVSMGYTNASWTLKCDLTCEYVCRLLNHMEQHGHTKCCPRRNPSVPEEPAMEFTSGYVQRSIADMPKRTIRLVRPCARSGWRSR